MAAKKKTSTSKRYTTVPATAKKPASKQSKSSAAAKSNLAAVETAISTAIDSNQALSAVKVVETTDASAILVAEPTPALPPVEQNMPNAQTSALVNSLRDPSADAAGEAAAALGASGDKTAVAPLMEVLSNADGYFHPVVRAAAAASLGQLGDKRAVPALITGIRDEMAEASAESIRALAQIGDPRAVEPVVAVVRNNDGYFLSFVRRVAVQALVKLGGPEATAMLKVVAENYDEDPVVRQVAIDALS